MKIAYLTESMGWSGGAAQTLRMALALQARQHTIVLIAQPDSDILSRAKTAGLPTLELRMRQDYDVPAAWRLSRLLRAHQIEILHAHHSTAHAIGLMAAYFSGVPVFVVSRRVTFRIRTNPFSRLKYRARRVNGYVAVAEAVKKELIQSGLTPERIEVIPSVIDGAQTTAQDRDTVRKELGLEPDSVVIGTIANYAEFKGQDHLIHAAAHVCRQFPQARFVLAGRDTEKLSALVERLGIHSSVRLLGFRTDVPRLMAALDIFVLPSLQEAAATALREAMAAGLPSIGTRVGGIPESIEDGVTGLLVTPANPEAIENAIVRLLKNPIERRQIAERGQAFSLANFSIVSALAKTEALYQCLLILFSA